MVSLVKEPAVWVTPETCEDRDYECCRLFPPVEPEMTPAEYVDWYDWHVLEFVRVSGSPLG